MIFRVQHLSRRVTGRAFWFGQFDEANLVVCDGENRATSADCGPIWPQTFKYFEAFGNLTKSGNSCFSAGYSPSTNCMTTIGWSTPTYNNGGYTYHAI